MEFIETRVVIFDGDIILSKLKSFRGSYVLLPVRISDEVLLDYVVSSLCYYDSIDDVGFISDSLAYRLDIDFMDERSFILLDELLKHLSFVVKTHLVEIDNVKLIAIERDAVIMEIEYVQKYPGAPHPKISKGDITSSV